MPLTIASLPWLPAAPGDFNDRCKALAATPTGDGEGCGPALQRLASCTHSMAQALVFSRTLRKLRKSGVDLAPLSPFRLAVVSNASMGFAADFFAGAAARCGIALDLVQGEYDQVMQEALDPGSQTCSAGADAILLALDYRWYGLDAAAEFGPQWADMLEASLARLEAAVEGFRQNSGASLILSTLALPPTGLFGSYERRVAASAESRARHINDAICALAGRTGAYVLDVEQIARQVGTDAWFDPVGWNAQKQPFAAQFNPVYADRLGNLLGAIRGKSRKCLVLDLDNTCWGGAIGDEGMDGIVLGQGSAKGEAFISVQRMAKALRNRGVILAVSSKNNHDTALQPFREHSEMVLREGDIAVFQANWSDKASNLEAIARTLNIGIDSLVLLDDNPAERAQMRAALPMVAVPEVPDDPAWFAWTIHNAGYFEAVGFGDEDMLRAQSYAADSKRAEIRGSARNLGDYLSALKMEMSVEPFTPRNRGRVTQLINKTNQFNLATNRYTETEVEAMELDPATLTLTFRLGDTFGDLGLIAIVIARIDGTAATITDWLMSCRVLGRKVEEAMTNVLLEALGERGVTTLAAHYAPTAKNGMVREHFDRLGFSLLGEDAGGRRDYTIDIAASERFAVPMTIHLRESSAEEAA